MSVIEAGVSYSEQDLRPTITAQTSMEEVLGKPSEDRLGFYTQPATIQKYEGTSRDVYAVTFPSTPLYGSKLIDLVTESLPGKWPGMVRKNSYFNIRVETFEDWNIIGNKNKDAQKLVNAHTSLDPQWAEFVTEHFPAFAAAFKVKSNDEVLDYIEKKKRDLVTKEDAIDRLDELVKEVAPRGYKPYNFTWRHLDHFGNIVNTDLDEHGYKQASFDKYPGAREVHRVLQRLSPSARGTLLEGDRLFGGLLLGRKTIVDPEKPPGILYSGYQSEDRKFYYVEHLGEGRVRIEAADASVDLVAQGKDIQEVKRHVSRRRERFAVYPVIVWERSYHSNQRKYLSSQGETAEVDKGERPSTVAGLLATVYMSDDVRRALPERRGFRPGGKLNNMLHAQNPLQVLMEKEMITNQTQVFPAIEEYVEAAK